MSAPLFTIGQRVQSPLGKGLIVAYFKATRRPAKATYTVKLRRYALARPFHPHELRPA